MSDDDLRFGDVSGGGGSSGGMIDLFVKIITFIILAYVTLLVAEALFEIPIPFV